MRGFKDLFKEEYYKKKRILIEVRKITVREDEKKGKEVEERSFKQEEAVKEEAEEER